MALRRRRRTERTATEHQDALTDLTERDAEIDNLLRAAGELTAELQLSVQQASARLRDSIQEGDDGAGRGRA